jgi:serine/threonine protein kinase
MQNQGEEAEISLVGRVLNQKYRLIEDLAEGGMAVVYKAQHIFLEDLCAVKIIKRSLASKEEMLKRFQREARLTRQVARRSPYVIAIYDFGVEEDIGFFYVMELLNGHPFADILQDPKNPPPLENTARLVCQICEALSVVHEEGLVHRDIKPDNIFLHRDANSNEEIVKLLDFGIARPTDQKATMLTNYGRVMGTPEYMSPEQCRGPTPQQYERGESHLDGRSDIYSLGVLLYQCLTGDVPFAMPPDGGTMAIHKVMAGHVMEKPVPPNEKRPDLRIPKNISDVVVKSLAKDPKDRYQTMAAFRDAILSCFPGLRLRLGEEPPQESKLQTIEFQETSPVDSADHIPATPASSAPYEMGAIEQTAMDVHLPPEMLEAARQWAINAQAGGYQLNAPQAGGVMLQESPPSSPFATHAPQATSPSWEQSEEASLDTFNDEHRQQNNNMDMAATITAPMASEMMEDLRQRAQAAMQRSRGEMPQTPKRPNRAPLWITLGVVSVLILAVAAYFVFLAK